MKHKYTENQLRDIINTTTSIRQALIKLNISPQGGNYRIINNAIKRYNIDTSHFTGMGWSKGKKLEPKKEIEHYLTENSTITSHKLRLKLLNEKYFDHKCSNCNLEVWLGEPIPLELDHIDGNNKNNKLENLRLLCPNCHAKTPNYRGRNIKK